MSRIEILHYNGLRVTVMCYGVCSLLLFSPSAEEMGSAGGA
jgi:hypothetical protein